MNHSFFIHSPVSGHLGCYHAAAIVNSASVNNVVLVSFSIMAFLGCMSSSYIVGSYSSFIPTCKRMTIECFLTPNTKINSKWVKNINVSSETINLLEENIGRTLYDIHHRNILYDPPPRVMGIKTKINKWDLIKLKSFFTAEETINKVKRQSSE